MRFNERLYYDCSAFNTHNFANFMKASNFLLAFLHCFWLYRSDIKSQLTDMLRGFYSLFFPNVEFGKMCSQNCMFVSINKRRHLFFTQLVEAQYLRISSNTTLVLDPAVYKKCIFWCSEVDLVSQNWACSMPSCQEL